VALAPDRPEGYLALGDYREGVLRDHVNSLEAYGRGRRVAPANADVLAATAFVEQALGRWETAVQGFRQAERLDPRSPLTQLRLCVALTFLRRYPEAVDVCDRGLVLAPSNLALIEARAMLFLCLGDLAGARAVLAAAPVEPTALAAYVATYWDLVWLLDEGQRALLLRLTPSAFDDDRGTWSMCLGQTAALRGDHASARAYAEEARNQFQGQLAVLPDDPQRHVLVGLAMAYMGRKEEAMREGERGVALARVTPDAFSGAYYQHLLVRIYTLVGEPEKALDQLEPLLKIPYYLSPGWLKIDPNFDPLRNNPRFQKLVAGT
jgi:tetratricopeptide (TPR) repeat protein